MMKNTFKFLLVMIASIIFLIPFTVTTHAETNSKKSVQNKSISSQAKKYKRYKRRVRKSGVEILEILDVMPESGKAREVGFDESYLMETTTILDSDFALCAKASRGLIMLDNAMLKKCGGRAKGWPFAPRVVK